MKLGRPTQRSPGTKTEVPLAQASGPAQRDFDFEYAGSQFLPSISGGSETVADAVGAVETELRRMGLSAGPSEKVRAEAASGSSGFAGSSSLYTPLAAVQSSERARPFLTRGLPRVSLTETHGGQSAEPLVRLDNLGSVTGRATLPWRPTGVQPLLHRPTKVDDVAILTGENEALRLNLQASQHSEAELSNRVSLLQAKLRLWQQAARRIAQRETRIVDYLRRTEGEDAAAASQIESPAAAPE